ncbi:apolipoprotein A1/A4/E family protein [Noviherbaspirillum galbum]|uniref:Apolipoprotein A1/A4/E family protein n=1 Tax=Noviherbaspirillum galbum TaxID=2709383 RepID=A0A6B3SZK4_9BURK|nr:apolipoprotein A1/A4/E family protein [Noviherbaspirillum galbum]NEX64199.1 apolipoprotein A1/A4/E family protein [Noviherbaspirillum galbum]
MERNNFDASTFGWLLGSAALGALAMFLTDPERGQARRAVATEKLSDVLTDTRDYLGAKTSDLSDRFRDTTSDLSDRLRDTTSELTDRVKSTTNELSGRIKSRTDDVRDRVSDRSRELRAETDSAPLRSSIRLGSESYFEKAANRELWMIGGAILGAIGMYLADPDMGAHRRTSATNRLRNMTPGMGTDNFSSGYGSDDNTGSYASGGGVAGTGSFADNDQPQGSDTSPTRH